MIELVVVVVILGIITAIAIPRLSRGARGASDGALRADLAVLRNAIEHYAAEHHGVYPWPLWSGLLNKTDADGNIGPSELYGPYLRSQVAVPVGPNAGATLVHRSSTSPPTVDESKTDRGWAYNDATGEIVANTDDLDDSGVAYNTY